jgi:hypothetical protein
MIRILTMPDVSTRLSTTGSLLVRSGIEIERLLQAMAQDRDTVTATLESVIFLSRVMSMDAEDHSVLLEYSDHKPANSALLAAQSVKFRCNHRGAQFAFACKKPRQAMHSGQPAIRMSAPPIVLGAQPGHGVRTPLPRPTEVRCDLRMGLQLFAARLVDVGLDGKAYIEGDPAIPVCDGTMLKGARLRPGNAEPMTVDLDVEKVVQSKLPDGSRGTRIGCRLVVDRSKLEEIIRLFIVDLA